MPITLDNPEIEAIIQCRLQSGAFATVDQVLLDALAAENMWDKPTPEDLAWLDEKLKSAPSPSSTAEKEYRPTS